MNKSHRKTWPKSKTSDISKHSPSPLHHTFLLGGARFTAQPLSALDTCLHLSVSGHVTSKILESFSIRFFIENCQPLTWECHVTPVLRCLVLRDGPLEKWWGGGGEGGGGEKTPKKFMQGKMPRKKIHAKKTVKKKNSCWRKVQLWLFQKVWVSDITRHNMNKQ